MNRLGVLDLNWGGGGGIFVVKIKLIHVWYVIGDVNHDNLPRKCSL